MRLTSLPSSRPTFVDNDHGLAGGDNLIALNNIFVGSRILAMKAVDGNSVAAYNLFWNNGSDAEASNLDRGTTLYADPRLGSEFQLLSASPAIDAGVAHFKRQGRSVLRLSGHEIQEKAPDLGAFESDLHSQ